MVVLERPLMLAMDFTVLIQLQHTLLQVIMSNFMVQVFTRQLGMPILRTTKISAVSLGVETTTLLPQEGINLDLESMKEMVYMVIILMLLDRIHFLVRLLVTSFHPY